MNRDRISNGHGSCIFSGRCQRECLNTFVDPRDRWAHTACGICCVDDVDDNGSISEDDMHQHYEDFCGHTTKMMTREIKHFLL